MTHSKISWIVVEDAYACGTGCHFLPFAITKHKKIDCGDDSNFSASSGTARSPWESILPPRSTIVD